MKHPILIFYVLLLLLLIYVIKAILQYLKTKKWWRFCFKLISTGVLVTFLYIWFVPIDVGWDRESPITKFRFQVFITELDHYGSPSSLQSNMFTYRPSRYGWMYLRTKVGGWQEYFGLKPLQKMSAKDQWYLHRWKTFLHAIITKDKTHIKQNSFAEVECIDCIYPPENKQQVYAIDYLLSKNVFDKYAFLFDEVVHINKIDERLIFSFSLKAPGGERYNETLEFHYSSNDERYKLKSTYSIP